jgi:hypothetical protein
LLAITFFTVSQCIWRRWGKKTTARRRRSGEVVFSADRAEFATYDARAAQNRIAQNTQFAAAPGKNGISRGNSAAKRIAS